MVIAAEPVHSGDALVLTTTIHEPHVNVHASPFAPTAGSAAGSEHRESAPPKSVTELLNPKRRFVHRDRPGIHVGDIAGARSKKVCVRCCCFPGCLFVALVHHRNRKLRCILLGMYRQVGDGVIECEKEAYAPQLPWDSRGILLGRTFKEFFWSDMHCHRI